MLGQNPISTYPISSHVATVPEALVNNEISGGITLYAPRINGVLHYDGAVTLPSLTVSGTLVNANWLSGGVSLSAPTISGTFSMVKGFTGTVTTPKLKVTGTLLKGNILSGGVIMHEPHVNGTFGDVSGFTGNVNLPKLQVDGILSTTIADSTLSFDEDTSCTQ